MNQSSIPPSLQQLATKTPAFCWALVSPYIGQHVVNCDPYQSNHSGGHPPINHHVLLPVTRNGRVDDHSRQQAHDPEDHVCESREHRVPPPIFEATLLVSRQTRWVLGTDKNIRAWYSPVVPRDTQEWQRGPHLSDICQLGR